MSNCFYKMSKHEPLNCMEIKKKFAFDGRFLNSFAYARARATKRTRAWILSVYNTYVFGQCKSRWVSIHGLIIMNSVIFVNAFLWGYNREVKKKKHFNKIHQCDQQRAMKTKQNETKSGNSRTKEKKKKKKRFKRLTYYIKWLFL